MGYIVMPRKHFATTKTGIVIGSAYVHKPNYEVDEDMSRIQDHLLHGVKPLPWRLLIEYIGLICLTGAMFTIIVYCDSQLNPLFSK